MAESSMTRAIVHNPPKLILELVTRNAVEALTNSRINWVLGTGQLTDTAVSSRTKLVWSTESSMPVNVSVTV